MQLQVIMITIYDIERCFAVVLFFLLLRRSLLQFSGFKDLLRSIIRYLLPKKTAQNQKK